MDNQLLNLPEPDYSLPYNGTPGMSDFVEFDHAGEWTCGLVVDILAGGINGPLLVVRVSPVRTVDIHWQRVRRCEMPGEWPEPFAAGEALPVFEV